MKRESQRNSIRVQQTTENEHVLPSHRHSIPLYGPLEIENAESFMETQREIFNKCFLKPCPILVKLDHFDIATLLGEGGFGKVYLVIYKKRYKFYAMKIMKKKKLVENEYIRFALNEKRILQSLNFPFCVRLEFMLQDKVNLYFFLPFISGGELFTHLKKLKRFNEDLTKFYAAQVVLALEFLHYCNLVYRDLKPENVLVDYTGYIKVTDFGFTKQVKNRLYTFCGTPEYIAPEIVLGLGHSKPVDYWALGVMTYEMVKGKTPFQSDNEVAIFNKIITLDYEMPKFFSKNLQDLIACLLQVDMTHRYGNLKNGIEDIKQHNWFGQINWLELLSRKVTPPYLPEESDNITNHFPHSKSLSNLASFDSSNTENDYDEYFKDF